MWSTRKKAEMSFPLIEASMMYFISLSRSLNDYVNLLKTKLNEPYNVMY